MEWSMEKINYYCVTIMEKIKELYTLKRDEDTCDHCENCDLLFKGFSSMEAINIRPEDFAKEYVSEAVKSVLGICPTESITLERPQM